MGQKFSEQMHDFKIVFLRGALSYRNENLPQCSMASYLSKYEAKKIRALSYGQNKLSKRPLKTIKLGQWNQIGTLKFDVFQSESAFLIL